MREGMCQRAIMRRGGVATDSVIPWTDYPTDYIRTMYLLPRFVLGGSWGDDHF